jgi:hypothetical protein
MEGLGMGNGPWQSYQRKEGKERVGETAGDGEDNSSLHSGLGSKPGKNEEPIVNPTSPTPGFGTQC